MPNLFEIMEVRTPRNPLTHVIGTENEVWA